MTAYERGVYREKQTAKRLRADGYVVAESRGSHGPADLLAAKYGQVLVIQVKAGSAPLGPWVNELFTVARDAGALAIVADWPRRGVLRLRRITGYHRPRSHTWPLEPFTVDEAAEAACGFTEIDPIT
jgi:Holliday junction resolvase